MTYNKGSRHATSKVVIKVERGTPPKVVIAQQPQPKENPTKDIIIEVFVESTMSSTSVRWDCVEEDGYGYVDLYQAGVALTPLSYTLNKEAGADKVTRNLALVLAAHSLSNGVSYKFRVTVAHADSTAIGETIITTNAAPSQGIIRAEINVVVAVVAIVAATATTTTACSSSCCCSRCDCCCSCCCG